MKSKYLDRMCSALRYGERKRLDGLIKRRREAGELFCSFFAVGWSSGDRWMERRDEGEGFRYLDTRVMLSSLFVSNEDRNAAMASQLLIWVVLGGGVNTWGVMLNGVLLSSVLEQLVLSICHQFMASTSLM